MKKIKNLEVYEGMLIVVDMVNGFVREGALHDEAIARIIPRQIELIKEAHAKGYLVVFVKDTHDEDAVEYLGIELFRFTEKPSQLGKVRSRKLLARIDGINDICFSEKEYHSCWDWFIWTYQIFNSHFY